MRVDCVWISQAELTVLAVGAKKGPRAAARGLTNDHLCTSAQWRNRNSFELISAQCTSSQAFRRSIERVTWSSIALLSSAVGIRDEWLNAALGKAMMAGPQRAMAVTRLRRGPHEPGLTCWLHGSGFCLST